RDVPTVQGVVVAAARALLGDTVRVVGASRTDAGVHALRQVASLATDRTLDTASVGRALNATLPPDIRVRAVGEAADGFDARRRGAGLDRGGAEVTRPSARRRHCARSWSHAGPRAVLS